LRLCAFARKRSKSYFLQIQWRFNKISQSRKDAKIFPLCASSPSRERDQKVISFKSNGVSIKSRKVWKDAKIFPLCVSAPSRERDQKVISFKSNGVSIKSRKVWKDAKIFSALRLCAFARKRSKGYLLQIQWRFNKISQSRKDAKIFPLCVSAPSRERDQKVISFKSNGVSIKSRKAGKTLRFFRFASLRLRAKEIKKLFPSNPMAFQ
jgi:hypothetical protein